MAGLISSLYGMIMVAVFVGIAISIVQDGVLSPSAMFLILLIGQMVIAGVVHPKEMYCLLYSPLYLITVPSMYVVLIIYSFSNMNDITWGTREIRQKKTAPVIICTLLTD